MQASIWVEAIGMGAACLTTGAFFPQAIKTVRSGQTAGLSLVMYLMIVVGVVLWLLYGLFLGSWPLILANAIALPAQLAILAMLLRDARRGRDARRTGGVALPTPARAATSNAAVDGV